MKRMVKRTYQLDERDVREAIVAWLEAGHMPAPEYVGNAGGVTWTHQPLDVKIEWEEEIDADQLRVNS